MASVNKTTSVDIAGVKHEPKLSSIHGCSVPPITGIRSDFHYVEHFGLQIPILVNEALTFNENSPISISYSENNWAWMVYGRRLLIWQYNDSQKFNKSPNYRNKNRQYATIAQCRELSLPHCDIGHKAALIRVFLSEGQEMASCLAVSPTGDVRFWPSIAHDGTTVDTGGILDGQEFDQLLELPEQMGYLLVTTTCSLSLLQLQFFNGRHVLKHKAIRPSSGFLGTLSKKFASIIIGINNSSDKEHNMNTMPTETKRKHLLLACSNKIHSLLKLISIAYERSAEGIIFTVLADRMVQRWRLNNGIEQFLYEDTEIMRKIHNEFVDKFWNLRENLNLELHMLQMQLIAGKMYILAGAVNMANTLKMCYGVYIASCNTDAMTFIKFIPIKLSQFYNNSTKNKCLRFRFLICHTYLYIYDEQFIYPLNLSNLNVSDIELEKIELCFQDDIILSGAICSQTPIFFSRSHGFLSVNPGDLEKGDNFCKSYSKQQKFTAASEGGLQEELTFDNLILLNIDPEEMLKDFKDSVTQMKAAFIYHLKHNIAMRNFILNELMYNINNDKSHDIKDLQELDRIVVKIVEELANDIPAADPRWESLWIEKGDNVFALGSSKSLQISRQLKDKEVALRYFVEFLQATEIWDKLNSVSDVNNGTRPTYYVITDVFEKLIGATSLRALRNKHSKIIDEAIVHTLKMRGDSPNNNLTAQDMFFAKPYEFQDVFLALSDIAHLRLSSQQSFSSISIFLSHINAIVLNVFHSIIMFREQNVLVFPLNMRETTEYLPWTAMSGKKGLRDAFSYLIELSIRHGVPNTVDMNLKQQIYHQVLEIIDIILDGRKKYLDSINDVEKCNVLQQQFEVQRRDLISIFINVGQYEFAAKLAEKYLDFHSLITICDKTNCQDRLDSYIVKYEEHDFSQIAINWHLGQNRQGEVFKRFKENQIALSQFMRDQPVLGWIQNTFNGDFERASRILFQLANAETELLHRKKSILSLAKLAAFAAVDADVTTQVSSINTELTIVDYQEHLNENVLEIFGYDTLNQRVMKMEDIINLFISDQNYTATEYDFRKAIELLRVFSKFTTFEQTNAIYHKILCAAILRNNWIDYDINYAINYVQNLFFFKLIEICHLLDGDVASFLPPVEAFQQSTELGDLRQHKSFLYLLKLSYELFTELYDKKNKQTSNKGIHSEDKIN